MATLSVVVPATDRPATLQACLHAIDAAQPRPNEVVVVEEPFDSGPASARNLGVQRATGDLVCFVDADVCVHNDAFGRILAAFDADADLVGIFGAYDDSPSARDAVSAFRNLLHHHMHLASAGTVTTFWAGLGAIRREAFVEVGGFDEFRYPSPSIEDIELGLRLSAERRKILLEPSIQGTHLKRWTLSSMVTTDFARRGLPWVQLILRNPRGKGNVLNLGRRHRVSAMAVLVSVWAVLARRFALALAAFCALISLNWQFYALMARRRGARCAFVGVGLHAVHHLTSVSAVAAGIATHLVARDPRTKRVSGQNHAICELWRQIS